MQNVEKVQESWLDRVQEEASSADYLNDDAIATKGKEKIYVASYLQLMWWRFLKHKLALMSAMIIILLYSVAAFAEFVAPYIPDTSFVQYKLAPPTKIHLIDSASNWQRPFVYKAKRERDPQTLRNIYTEDTATIYPIRLFVKGTEYKMWGFWTMDRHLFGIDAPREEQGVFLIGADRLGRDLFSRVCYGARVSLTIGLVSVVVSLIVGILLGGISGFYGGWVDNAIQRLIEFIRSVPEIPLIMALAAALPANLPVTQLYFGVTIVLAFVGWTGLARVVRGRHRGCRPRAAWRTTTAPPRPRNSRR